MELSGTTQIFGLLALIGWAFAIPAFLGIDFLDELIESLDVFDLIDTDGVGTVVTSFVGAFGTVGFFMSLGGNQLAASLAVSLVTAVILSYGAWRLIKYSVSNQTPLPTREDLLGADAILTTSVKPGEVGQAMVGTEKITIRAEGANILKRHDVVVVIAIDHHLYIVKKKQH